MTTLYKLDSKGKVRTWSIDFDYGSSSIVVESGLEDGKKVETVTPIKSGKNIGRSNETTIEQQALSQIQSDIDKKLCEGYVRDKESLNAHGVTGSGCPAPMLANKYDPKGVQSGSKTLAQLGLTNVLVGVSPKLDGNRCIAHIKWDKKLKTEVTLYTRKGKPFFVIPHIVDHLKQQVEDQYAFVGDFPGEVYLDGELYTDQVSFNELNGILKRQSRTPEQEKQLLKVDYCLYDIMLDKPYTERFELLGRFKGPCVKVVPCYQTYATEKNLQRYLEDFLAAKWEGCMIRQLNQPYQNKRTNQLLKYKTFEDAEFIIAGFNESVSGNTLGSIIFHLRGRSEEMFCARYKGTDAEQKEIWDNQDKYLGRTMTVEYFNLSEYNVPRFPVAKAFR